MTDKPNWTKEKKTVDRLVFLWIVGITIVSVLALFEIHVKQSHWSWIGITFALWIIGMLMAGEVIEKYELNGK